MGTFPGKGNRVYKNQNIQIADNIGRKRKKQPQM